MSVLFYNREILKKYTRWRWGEEKFGEIAGVVESLEALKESDARYVIVGIPEDIGVRANLGKPGAAKAWKECLTALCNMQSNEYTRAKNVVILGEVDCTTELQDARTLTEDDPFYPTKIGSLVKAIDNKVTEVVSAIVKLSKIPIIIGGGHNNSYGNLKGTSHAFNGPVNCINMDAHTDFRSLEHRHSGNGFSYAMEEGFLSIYYIFGIHRNYTSHAIFERMKEQKGKVHYTFFEDLSVSEENFNKALKEAKKQCCNEVFGLELDLDAIVGMGSSAMTPSGFTLEEARHFVRFFGAHKNCAYVHLCEGAPEFELHAGQVGKALAYLISDIVAQ
ncbi:MAG: formimidoylglutamase [Bacteroidota bacterium]